MSTGSSENRRQCPRARVAMAVREQYPDRVLLSQASDISPNGIFLAKIHEAGDRDEERIPGSKCWLEFKLPTSTTRIRARGQVVRQVQYQRYQLTAIAFASIAPSHRRLIHEYVSGPDQQLPPPMFLPPMPYL